MNRSKNKNNNNEWKLVYNGFQPAKEGLREALCTLGNGYFATRGAICEAEQSRVHYPGTYIAGLYNKLKSHVSGRIIANEDFVNCPNWLFLIFRIEDGIWIRPSIDTVISYYQQLDMKNGILIRKMRLKDRKGRITAVHTQRIVHRVYPHRAAIKYDIIPENYSGKITVRSALDGDIQNQGVARYRSLNSKHLKHNVAGKFSDNGIYLSVRTTQSNIEIAQAARVRIFNKGKEIHPIKTNVIKSKRKISEDFVFEVRKGQRYEIEKIAAVYTSKDMENYFPRIKAVTSVEKSDRFETLLKTHKQAWEMLWEKFDIQVDGDDFMQKVLRLHAFHLLQTGSVHNLRIDAGVPARGLHGEAYRGHIFWDEIFIMPFFTLRVPEIAKAFLLYRYRRLEQARKYAQENGYKGAMFPWQTSSTGEEETQVIHLNPISGKWDPDYSRIQRHISFAIVYDFWHYWKCTEDMDFLKHFGAEVILSVAQFSSSLTKYSHEDNRYHTYGVMGPDEFHERFPGCKEPGFKDNAYTNIMIVWTLRAALRTIQLIPEIHLKRLTKKLSLDKKAFRRWEDITHKMNIVINEQGIISQFDGYFDLKELDLTRYKEKYKQIGRMDRILRAEGKSPNDYKIAKQADALMAFYLFPFEELQGIFKSLGYRIDRRTIEKNYNYYMKRASHGSTLSKVVYSYLAHMLNKPDRAGKLYADVLKSDIYDTQGGTTPEGIHCGVMAGSIMFIIKAVAGVMFHENKITIDPNFLPHIKNIKFSFCYKGLWFSLSVNSQSLSIFVHGDKYHRCHVLVEIYGKRHDLFCGRTYSFSLKRKKVKITEEGKALKMYQGRILVVDADITLTEMLQTRLQAMGYLVECAHSAGQALDILRDKWIDMIVLDIVLRGEMHGFDLIKRVRRNKKISKIPIIVQTSRIALKPTCESMGVQAFFAKPYSTDEFLHKIRDMLVK